MRGLVSLVLVLVIAYGIYYSYIRQVQPAGGGAPTQAITTTGVQNDLLRIAQAERMYFAEHGNYADLDTLTTSGALSMTRPERDGYTYNIEVSAEGFPARERSWAGTSRSAAGPTKPWPRSSRRSWSGCPKAVEKPN